MVNEYMFKNLMDSLVPITRFNKGEASRIFDEVSRSGTKIVLKNNTPACVLMDPKQYEEMLEQLEDYSLIVESIKRLDHNEDTADFSEVLCSGQRPPWRSSSSQYGMAMRSTMPPGNG